MPFYRLRRLSFRPPNTVNKCCQAESTGFESTSFRAFDSNSNPPPPSIQGSQSHQFPTCTLQRKCRGGITTLLLDGVLGGRHHAAGLGYAILSPPSLVGCPSDLLIQSINVVKPNPQVSSPLHFVPSTPTPTPPPPPLHTRIPVPPVSHMHTSTQVQRRHYDIIAGRCVGRAPPRGRVRLCHSIASVAGRLSFRPPNTVNKFCQAESTGFESISFRAFDSNSNPPPYKDPSPTSFPPAHFNALIPPPPPHFSPMLTLNIRRIKYIGPEHALCIGAVQ